MGLLRSPLLAGDRALEACAVSDPAHIMPRAQGPHVRKIQDALDQIDRAGLAQTSEYKTSTYGPATAAAVVRFKTSRKILNHLNQIDPIVGKKTIKALDDELLRGASADGPVDLTDPSRYLDIVVRFVGGGTTDGEDWAKAGLKLEAYQAATTKRRFLGVGKAAEVGRAGGVESALGEIIAARRAEESFGLIFIYGSSLGGRQAIELAKRLLARNIPVTYVGLSDAAFFGHEAINIPDADPLMGEPSNYPEFLIGNDLPGGIIRESYYQTWGNHVSRINRTGRWLWTSDLQGEVHGCPILFRPFDVSSEVDNWRRSSDRDAHNHACAIADRKIQTAIQNRLNMS
jgi:hypothetical protein